MEERLVIIEKRRKGTGFNVIVGGIEFSSDTEAVGKEKAIGILERELDRLRAFSETTPSFSSAVRDAEVRAWNEALLATMKSRDTIGETPYYKVRWDEADNCVNEIKCQMAERGIPITASPAKESK